MTELTTAEARLIRRTFTACLKLTRLLADTHYRRGKRRPIMISLTMELRPKPQRLPTPSS